MSFSVQRGWLVAIVGPTGAGKTSLARALTGNLALQSGSIRVDGIELSQIGSRGLDRVAYVPQDDVLHGSLALGRTLRYSASLRVPPGAAHGERDRRVHAAMAELGLEHHAGVAVASLSGGQRKRANIAGELVGQPDVLVLDEPTSGLDPGYEKAVMTSLRQLADAGRTVIAVTHSMQALERCDRVLFLAEGGRVAYFGPPAHAAAYFGRGDTADVFLALDTESGQAWKERFRAHPSYAEYISPAATGTLQGSDAHPVASRRESPTWATQLGILLRRQVALLRSDRRHMALLLLQGPILGLLIWLVVQADSLRTIPHLPGHATDAAETVAMFVALSATWLGASNAVREIVKERHILRREVDAGLFPSAYVASKAIVLGLVTMAQTTALTLIACASQRPSSSGALLGSGWVELAVIGALVGLAGTALGLLLSALATSPDKALALLPMSLVCELVLAGRWASDATAPGLSALRDLTGAHWGVSAILATVTQSPATWFGAAAVLVLLAAGSLALTVVMVRHHTRSALDQVPLSERLDTVRSLAAQRGGVVAGVASLGVLAVALSIVVGGTGHDPVRSHTPVVAAPAVAAAPVLPAPVAVPANVPPAPSTTLALRTVAAPVTRTSRAPPTTTTTMAPSTTTTVAPAPAPARPPRPTPRRPRPAPPPCPRARSQPPLRAPRPGGPHGSGSAGWPRAARAETWRAPRRPPPLHRPPTSLDAGAPGRVRYPRPQPWSTSGLVWSRTSPRCRSLRATSAASSVPRSRRPPPTGSGGSWCTPTPTRSGCPTRACRSSTRSSTSATTPWPSAPTPPGPTSRRSCAARGSPSSRWTPTAAPTSSTCWPSTCRPSSSTRTS